MTKMVSSLFGGPGKKQKAKAEQEKQQAKSEQKVAMSRQQQEQASVAATTEESLGKARRTPRGRRLLIGEQGSTLG